MPFPKKNTSVPVHLDRHSPTETSSNQQQQPENHINSPLNNSSFLNNTQTTPNNPQQLGPIRTTYINQQEFDQLFQFIPPKRFSWQLFTRKFFSDYFQCFCSFSDLFHFFLSFLPIFGWLPSYNFKENLAGDFIAGITVGVVHVPQAIAYAILAGLEPVYGLYTSFFSVLFYAIFGTSRHVSIGPFAILALMTGISCRDIYAQFDKEFFEAEIKLLDDASHNKIGEENNFLTLTNMTKLIPRVEVGYSELVQTITLTAGLIQFAMAILRVEFLASYLSDQLVNGFCTGAAVHVVGVQLGKLLQLNLGQVGGPGYLYIIFFNLIQKLPQVNLIVLFLSIFGFAFLYLGKDVFSPKFGYLIPFVIPFELLLVILATAVSSFANLRDNFNVTVLNFVPTGLPEARLPRLDLLPYVFGDALEIAFVSVALHLSMCKVFNRRMGTKTDNNVELYALGLVDSLSSFFTAYPVTSVLGRSMLNVECGAKTQFSGLITGLLLLVVILWLGPILSSLPVCILAVIIIFSMKCAFEKIPREFLHLWRVSKIDFLIWIVTIFATILLNVMQGLALAVTFALLTTIFRIQWPRWHLLSNLTGTENYRDSGRYKRFTPFGHGIKIFRFDAPLLFTNVDHFAKSAITAILTESPSIPSNNNNITINGSSCDKNLFKISGTRKSDKIKKFDLNTHSLLERRIKSSGVKSLIVDCTGFTFVDYTSINALADLYHQLCELNINVLFAGAKAPVRDMLESCNFFNSVPKEQFYPTIHDAVLAASNKKKWQKRRRGFHSELSLKKVSGGGGGGIQDDTNSLCVGENELYQWSFKQSTDTHIIIKEENEEEEEEEEREENLFVVEFGLGTLENLNNSEENK
uniref:STAS domain-containing protein n=2 Tax=Meloidogyne incognita TaxID=6306 RepID=A0A914L3X8_MELIC